MGRLTECIEKLAYYHAGRCSWGTGFEDRFLKWIKWWKEWEKFQELRAEVEVSVGASKEKNKLSACVWVEGIYREIFS